MQTKLKTKRLVQMEAGKFVEDHLVNIEDGYYMGTFYLGAPHSQPVNLTLDTGSEFLAVKSSFCEERNKSVDNAGKPLPVCAPKAPYNLSLSQTVERTHWVIN